MIKRFLGIASALGMACALLMTASVAADAASARPDTSLFYARGTVYCTNGGPVTGIWVYVNDGGANGWASFTPIGSEAADYSYGVGLVPRGYWLAVGCGGNSSHWATTSYEEPSFPLSSVIDYDVFCANSGNNGACYAIVLDGGE